MKILRVHNRYREPGGEDVVERAEQALLREAGHEVLTFARDSREIDAYGPWERVRLPARASSGAE